MCHFILLYIFNENVLLVKIKRWLLFRSTFINSMGERRNHLALSCQVFNRILLCVHYVSWVNVRIKRTCSFLLWCHSFAFCLYLPLGPGISCLFFFVSFFYFVPSSCLPWLRYAPHLYALAGIQFILISTFNIKNFQFNLMTLYSLFYHMACPKK